MAERIKRYGIHIYIGHMALLAVLSAAWWGILYPNFSMTEGVFQVVGEETNGDKDGNRTPDKNEQHGPASRTDGFFAILGAEPGEIEIKSRFLETVSEIRGKEDGS